MFSEKCIIIRVSNATKYAKLRVNLIVGHSLNAIVSRCLALLCLESGVSREVASFPSDCGLQTDYTFFFRLLFRTRPSSMT